MPAVGLPLYPGFRVGLPGPPVRAAIAGHGADLVQLAGPVILGASAAAAARQLGLPAVAVLRQGDELARVYASLDVFVHSGPHETFGNTLQEAAASGLPVVAPATGGPLDLVRDGMTGVLVPPGDASALAAAVAALAASPRLRAAQGAAGRLAVLDRTWPARCEELVGHYERVLGAVPVVAGARA